MSGTVSKSVLCDPKQRNSELRLPKAESNVSCNGKGKLCKRQANVMKSSTKSEINISSLDKKQNLRRCQTKAETKPTSVFCCQKSEKLLKSKSLGFILENSSGGGKTKSPDPKVKFDPIFLFQLSLIGLLCLYLATGWQDETSQRKKQVRRLLRRPNVSLSVHQSNRPTPATLSVHYARQKKRQRVPRRDRQNRRNHNSSSTSQPREVQAGSPLRARDSRTISQIEDSLTWIRVAGFIRKSNSRRKTTFYKLASLIKLRTFFIPINTSNDNSVRKPFFIFSISSVIRYHRAVSATGCL